MNGQWSEGMGFANGYRSWSDLGDSYLFQHTVPTLSNGAIQCPHRFPTAYADQIYESKRNQNIRRHLT